MQLDLFLDSRAVMLANDVIGALAARLVRELLELDKQGFSQRLVAGRARLRELNREIFALYMANRTIQRR